MRKSDEKILTTHVGSIPRNAALREIDRRRAVLGEEHLCACAGGFFDARFELLLAHGKCRLTRAHIGDRARLRVGLLLEQLLQVHVLLAQLFVALLTQLAGALRGLGALGSTLFGYSTQNFGLLGDLAFKGSQVAFSGAEIVGQITPYLGPIVAAVTLLVSRGELNQPVQLLHAPPGAHKLTRQVVEQLRVTRSVAAGAEVVRRGDEAGAEVVVPDAIDHHTRGQRILA